MLTLVLAAALAVSPAPPPVDAQLPSGVAATAHRLAGATDALDVAVADHRAASSTTPSRELRLWALYQQRLYLALGVAPAAFGNAVVSRLPARLRADARDIVTARRSLVRLTPPTRLPLSAFRTGPPEPADRLLAHYREAERRFDVPWHVLAAVNFVESAFGKVRSHSSAGAQGPMQFLSTTWRAYGLGGDVHDPHDAILGAANMLRANGAPRRLRAALYAYNHSDRYVDAVLDYAAVIGRNRAAYYGFHAWQVFVRTPSGYRRLTDP